MNKQIKKSITVLAIIVFISTNIVYGDMLRNVMMGAKQEDSEPRFEEAKHHLSDVPTFMTINMNDGITGRNRRYSLSLALATSFILHTTLYLGGTWFSRFAWHETEKPKYKVERVINLKPPNINLRELSGNNKKGKVFLNENVAAVNTMLGKTISRNSPFFSYLGMPSSAEMIKHIGEYDLSATSHMYASGVDTTPYEEFYKRQTGKVLDSKTKELLRRFIIAVRNPAVSQSELQQVYKNLENSAYGATYGLTFDLFREYHDSIHGEYGKRVHKLLNFLLHEPRLSYLNVKYKKEYKDFKVLLDFFDGKLKQDDRNVLAALKRFEQDYEAIKGDFEKSYETIQHEIAYEVHAYLNNLFKDFSLPDLLEWFKKRDINIVFDGIEKEEFKKLNLVIAYQVVSQLPPDRCKGAKLLFTPKEHACRYNNENDTLLINFKGYFNEITDLNGVKLEEFYVALFHELAHRWHYKGLHEKIWSEFVDISWSWKKYLEIVELIKKNPKTIYLQSPSKSSNLERDFAGDLDLIGDPKEDLAITASYLYKEHDQLVQKAINNLIKYGNPNLAQKIFLGYAFYGHALSQDLWIVRADNRPINQDEGIYVYKNEGKIYLATLSFMKGEPKVHIVEMKSFNPNVPIMSLIQENDRLKRNTRQQMLKAPIKPEAQELRIPQAGLTDTLLGKENIEISI